MTPVGTGPLADRTGARVRGLMTKYAAPDAVTAAPVSDLFAVPAVAANFADPGRTYPVHTKAAAWASAAALCEAPAVDRAVAEKVKRACAYHRLSAEWDRLVARAWERVKAAAAPAAVKYALPAAGKYPIDTPAQVKAAAAYFTKYADRLAPEDRVEFAANVAKAAGDELDDDTRIRLEAEGGLARAYDWRPGLRLRAAFAKYANEFDLAAALEKVAFGLDAMASAAAAPSSLQGNLQLGGEFRTPAQLAELMRQVDRRMGWEAPEPTKSAARDTPTEARQKLTKVARAASGNWYEKEALAAVPDQAVRDLFGVLLPGPRTREELLTDPTKAAAFEQVLGDFGVRPVGRPARERVDWKALAAA